jgi:hypothetical protein
MELVELIELNGECHGNEGGLMCNEEKLDRVDWGRVRAVIFLLFFG